MKGTSKIRQQGYDDPLLVQVMKAHGFDEIPLFKHRPKRVMSRMDFWDEIGKSRDGDVNPVRRDVTDPVAMAAEIKALSHELGASAVGIATLTPIMIDEAVDLPHRTVICTIVGENYEAALGGPRAIEEESTSTYVRCAEISTEIARRIREMGYPARAHHNGGCDIQAIPAMYAAGLGEMGKHGSLIHPDLGASHRPGIITTNLPLATDEPLIFGVQDTCLKCNLCSNNCPADAIPNDEFIRTEGVRRWLTDVEKCYTMSRLRAQYCHICVDACPYVHKANGDPEKKGLYKQYMTKRKKAGYKTPAWFPDEEAAIIGEA